MQSVGRLMSVRSKPSEPGGRLGLRWVDVIYLREGYLYLLCWCLVFGFMLGPHCGWDLK